MKKAAEFFKKETVLCVAAVLAALSMLIVPPDAGYADYIDLRTLSVLFCLMTVMSGLKELGIFRRLALAVLGRAKTLGQLIVTLVTLCFFSSMLITNDVALITFVPLTFTVAGMLEPRGGTRWLVPVVVMQTVAANLGSMLTPVGNPQNLYLYGLSGMSLGAFLALMLPYAGASLAMLLVWCAIYCRGAGAPLGARVEGKAERGGGYLPWMYALLFAVCLLAVSRAVPYWAALIAVLAAVLAADRKALAGVDYSLLATFAAFFVFTGNMGRVDAFHDFLRGVIAGHEALTAVAASQVMSNVPAALLLSGFTDRTRELIIGTDLGGLGTLIASMASLISYKLLAKHDKSLRARYLLYFTAANIAFLAALLGLYCIIG